MRVVSAALSILPDSMRRVVRRDRDRLFLLADWRDVTIEMIKWTVYRKACRDA
jgi:hypothetical protein